MLGKWTNRRSHGLESPFEAPPARLQNYDDVVMDGGWAILDGEPVFVVPSAEGERSGFRTISDEATADAAVNAFVQNAYLAAREDYLLRSGEQSSIPLDPPSSIG